MSRRVQFIDAAGLRIDGRRPAEPRMPSFELGTRPESDGSCEYVCGATIVHASVFGPRQGTLYASDLKSDSASLVCHVALSAVSGERRRQVRRGNRMTDEFSAAITQAFESIVLLANYPNASITVALEVLQADGNEMEACLTATSLALADAGIAMRDLVIACSAGMIDGTVLTDMTAAEARTGCPLLRLGCLMHDPAAIVLFSIDARVSEAQLDDIYTSAVNGAAAVAEAAAKSLKNCIERRLEQRGDQ